MGGRRFAWTAQEDARLRELFLAGRTAPQIAQALGRTQAAITHRKGELRLLRTGVQAGVEAALEDAVTALGDQHY